MSKSFSMSVAFCQCFGVLVVLGCVSSAACLLAQEQYSSGIDWQEPSIVTPAENLNGPPSDALVLFDGTDFSKWRHQGWTIEDGVAVVGKSFLTTRDAFGDFQLHLEWSSRKPPQNSGQRRGNSGIYIMGRYELQILDSYENTTYFDGQAGSLYKQTPPAVNAMRKPGEWNTYDVFWTAPVFEEDGKLKSPAYITLLHNGVLVLNHFEVMGRTSHNQPPSYKPHPARAPFGLQNKLGHVRFRNIWIRDFKSPQVK